MTDAELDALNKQVARKLGWSFTDKHDPLCDLIMPNGKCPPNGRLPDYSRSIAAAWEILTDKCNTWELFCNGSTVDATVSSNYETASAEEYTAPLAICLAFLKLP